MIWLNAFAAFVSLAAGIVSIVQAFRASSPGYFATGAGLGILCIGLCGVNLWIVAQAVAK